MIPLEDIFISDGLSAWINEEKEEEYIVTIHKEYLELMEFWTNSIPNQIFDANYEKIINDPENEIKKLLNLLML